MKLDHGNPSKPLSECDQKLPIIFIVQEILSLQLVETNEALHFRHLLLLQDQEYRQILLPPAEAGCLQKALNVRDFSLSKFLYQKRKQKKPKTKQKNAREEMTYLQNQPSLYYASYENRKKEKNSFSNSHIGLTGCCIF